MYVYMYMHVQYCKTLINGVHEKLMCMVKCTQVKILQLFCWPITLHYNYLISTWKFAYKKYGW